MVSLLVLGLLFFFLVLPSRELSHKTSLLELPSYNCPPHINKAKNDELGNLDLYKHQVNLLSYNHSLLDGTHVDYASFLSSTISHRQKSWFAENLQSGDMSIFVPTDFEKTSTNSMPDRFGHGG